MTKALALQIAKLKDRYGDQKSLAALTRIAQTILQIEEIPEDQDTFDGPEDQHRQLGESTLLSLKKRVAAARLKIISQRQERRQQEELQHQERIVQQARKVAQIDPTVFSRRALKIATLDASHVDYRDHDNFDNTKLHTAVEDRDLTAVLELLQRGANPFIKNRWYTPREMAAGDGWREGVTTLLAAEQEYQRAAVA